MKRFALIAAAAGLAGSSLLFAQERIDASINARIRAEGLERSEALAVFDYLTTTIGPRLTASPAYKRAVDWTVDRLRAWGLDAVHAEPFEFGRGWELTGLTLAMTSPRYMPLIGYPRGWSPATSGRITGQPVMLGGKSAEELQAYAGRLGGAIVMTQPIRTAFIQADRPPASGDFRNPQPRLSPDAQAAQRAATQALNALIQRERPALVLESSGGEHGTVFVLGMSRRDATDNSPTVVLAAEHYNLIARMIDSGLPVSLSMDVGARFFDDDRNAYNVLAELKGTDPAIGDEVVMVGAHLDSWHTATGATDNADGVTVAMEAMRILKAIGARPRRTIRMALWGGEEQGLLGSRDYVQRHLSGDANRAAFDRFSVYFNLDNGFVPIYGFYLQGNEAMQPIMRDWLAPFSDLGATVATVTNIGSTDHLSFHNAGLPGFQAVHDYTGYDTRTHHTNMDTAERLDVTQLKQAAVVMASVLYHAAARDEKIPRPQPRPSGD
jgi:hypothetical protein